MSTQNTNFRIFMTIKMQLKLKNMLNTISGIFMIIKINEFLWSQKFVASLKYYSKIFLGINMTSHTSHINLLTKR